MTVREVIVALLDCQNMDKEFTVEVRVDAVDEDRDKGFTWCELGIENITICDGVGGGACATAKEPN